MNTWTFILMFLIVPSVVASPSPEAWRETKDNMCRVEVLEKTLTHPQVVWKYALQWCESRGDANAVNEIDRDGTASLGAYQFKPSTLFYYSTKYGIELTSDALWDAQYDTIASSSPVMDYEFQDRVVTQMILHRNDIPWHNEFPDCVAKLGRPPQ